MSEHIEASAQQAESAGSATGHAAAHTANGERPGRTAEHATVHAADGGQNARVALIEDYLDRLGSGEDIDIVREDFKRDFASVDASEIMAAEQTLLDNGMPIEKLQRLCDVHSALFHGVTFEERMRQAEAAVAAALGKPIERAEGMPPTAAELACIEGHPLHTFKRENTAAQSLIERIEACAHDEAGVRDALRALRGISVHYAKKGDLLYPLLDVEYGISGPARIMWTVDDEIRDELKALDETEGGPAWMERAHAVAVRAKEMIFKEENILFPACATHFNDEEWAAVYRDSLAYETCLEVLPAPWPDAREAESAPDAHGTSIDRDTVDSVSLPGGSMTHAQLRAFMRAIGMEVTVVDECDVNRYFNEGPKLFKRPELALGRSVFSCHPPTIEPMVRSIIDGFKSGANDEVPVWMEKNGVPALVTYRALRDEAGTYLGTLELVQNMEGARRHFMAADAGAVHPAP